jgi:hypothetical protein
LQSALQAPAPLTPNIALGALALEKIVKIKIREHSLNKTPVVSLVGIQSYFTHQRCCCSYINTAYVNIKKTPQSSDTAGAEDIPHLL